MFCEKCGKKLNEDEKFCTKCGAPVSYNTQISSAAVTPKEAVSEPAVEPDAQTTNYSQPQYAVPKPPKKPLSKKAKLSIILSSVTIFLVVVALVIINAIIIPNSKIINVADYIRIDFDEGTLYNGHLSVNISVDENKIYNKYLDNKGFEGSYNYIEDANELKSSFLEYCDVSAYVKNNSKKYNEKDLIPSNITTAQSLKNLSSDDTIVVNLRWVKSEDDLIMLDSAEKESNINFDKTDKTVEIKISDELKKDSRSVKEPIKFDFFKYANDNNLFITSGITDRTLSVSMKQTSFKAKNCQFNIKNDNYYDEDNNSITLSVKDKYGKKGKIDFHCSESVNLEDGDKAQFYFYDTDGKEYKNDIHIGETAVFLTTNDTEVIAKANESITIKEAKDNLDKIKDVIKESLEDENTPLIKDIYLLTSKDPDESEDTNMIFAVVKNNSDSSYFGYYLEDVYLSDGEIKFSSNSSDYNSWWSSYNSAKEFIKDSYILNNRNYRKTKIS